MLLQVAVAASRENAVNCKILVNFNNKLRGDVSRRLASGSTVD